MTMNKLFEEFKRYFPIYYDMLETYSYTRDKNLRVKLKDGKQFIFSYQEKDEMITLKRIR